MVFNCSCGSSFRLSGHLWVIVSDPFDSPEQVIITFLTTQKANSDTTVILSPGDHDFITHPTVVSYADAKIQRTEHILKRIEERDYEPRNSFSSEVTKEIQKGLIDSQFTPRYIKKAFLSANEQSPVNGLTDSDHSGTTDASN